MGKWALVCLEIINLIVQFSRNIESTYCFNWCPEDKHLTINYPSRWESQSLTFWAKEKARAILPQFLLGFSIFQKHFLYSEMFKHLHIFLKSVFLKKILDKIIWPRKLQKLPLLIDANWRGSFCNFLGQMVLSSTFLKKMDFSKY